MQEVWKNEKHRLWYLKNRERKLEYNKKYHAEHKDVINARHEDYYRKKHGLKPVAVERYWKRHKDEFPESYDRYCDKQYAKSHI